MKNQQKIESDILLAINVVGISPEETPGERERLTKNSEIHGKQAGRLKVWGDLYYQVWKWDGRVARVLFVVGLFLLFLFATPNTLQPVGTATE